MKKVLLTLFLILTFTTCIYAQDALKLQFPVKCQLNKNCWILNYVDNDSSTNWLDYKNGRETYDGHTGIDIAIKSLNEMKKGVDVLAASSGFVVATRDGVPDKNALAQNLSQLQNIGCGNRVAIKHNGGWITDYCHMKNGSIKVKKGDFVLEGQPLGQIGMSGLSEFPHLHINVQQNNQFFDPFTGLERYSKGKGYSLWNQQILYTPHIVYNVGVSDEIPLLLNVRNEKYKTDRISFFSKMIIVWVDMFHVEIGDTVDILVKNQNGNTFIKQHIVIEKANAKKLLYVGKKKPANGFSKGVYNVKISFKRPNTTINDYQSFNFTVY